WVGVARGVGALIGWGGALPLVPALHPATGGPAAVAQAAPREYVRFVGAGSMGVAGVWTLAKLIKPVLAGLGGAMRAARARKAGQADTLPITERDIPIGIVGLVSLLCFIPIGYLLWQFAVVSGL